MTAIEVWTALNEIKKDAVNLNFSIEQLAEVKYACDDLFREATGNNICPAYWIGGWGNER